MSEDDVKVNLVLEEEDAGEGVPKLRVFLEDDGCGGIDLKVLTKGYADYYIANLQSDGTLYLHDGLPDDLGLTLDAAGRIVVSEEAI